MTRPLRVLLVHPGAAWSTADVESGLRYGLEHHGVEIIRYRLDIRLERVSRWLNYNWRKTRKSNPTIEKPNKADMFYQAGIGALEMALRNAVDFVVIVSAMYLHPDVLIMMRRAGLRTVVLFTETPYDLEHELKIAALVDGGWTNERSAVPAFQAVNPRMGYLPHGWHPQVHGQPIGGMDALPAHDVVFVGSAFPDRVTFFNAIDWTGIDLGLYGVWEEELGLNAQVRSCVKAQNIENVKAAGLYRKARIGLNLYRQFAGWGRTARRVQGDSLSPRAYELAACGVFHLSQYRAEVPEVFGDLVPTFQTPQDAAALIRRWLADDRGRRDLARQLPACVAESSWVQRAACVIGDLQSLLAERPAA